MEFFSSRGIDFNEKSFEFYSFRQGFDFYGWFFQKSSFNILLSQISRNNIRDYKLDLKTIIKNSNNVTLNNTLKIINLRINNFINFYYLSDFWGAIANELDLYVYKLLWRFVKRCHPRRSNTWIYNKYWRSLSGVWRFVTCDPLNGDISILKSHNKLIVFNFSFPLALNFFDKRNHKKISLVLYEKFKRNFNSFYFLIYKKQKGLCFCCNKSLAFKKLKLVNLSSFKIGRPISLVTSLYLFHSYCNKLFH